MVDDKTLPLKREYGPYLCYQIIGMGENSIVYRARHRKTREKFAVRVVRITATDEAESIIADCKEELKALQAVESEYIVPIKDFGTDAYSLYIAMGDMQGETLMHRRKEFPDDLPSLAETAEMLHRIAIALDEIHLLGMIHGQLEPRNILFDAEGKAYLGDVGLSRLLKIIFKLGASNSFTMSKYSAPEVWEGERPRPASDQYSLACIAYELVTGRPPFVGSSVFDLMMQHREDIIELPHYVRGNLPVALTMPLLHAMAKNPEQRYSNVQYFYKEFLQSIKGYEGEATNYFTKPV